MGFFFPLLFFWYFNYAVFILVLLIVQKKSADIFIFVSLIIMYSLSHWLLGCFFITDFDQLDYDVQVIFILFRQNFLYFSVFWALWIYSSHQIRKLWGHYFFYFYLFLSILFWALLLYMFQNFGSCSNYCFSSSIFF